MTRLFTKFVFAPLSVATASLLYFVRYPRPPSHGPIDSDDEMFLHSREDHLAQLPSKTLLRGLFVHSFCTHPRLVDIGIHLMKAQNRPNPVFDSLIRHTFFAQFCGGETREEAVSLSAQLTANGIIPLLGYSKEVTNTAADIQHTEIETIRCIEAASSLKRPVFVAIKLSGLSFEDEMRRLEQEVHNLVSARPVIRSVFLARAREILSHYPDLVGRLERISTAAENLDVNLVVDAEIRFQGQVDSLPTSAILCWSLNSDKAHVWNTHQMIFRDSLPMLQEWCGNNSIKLVRGAYFYREPPETVAVSKAEVDATYDTAVEEVLTRRPNSLIIASHNHTTVVKAFRLLQQNRSVSSNRKICFAQLYGMGDDITYGLVRELGRSGLPQSPNVSIVKYIPYGGLRDVMPYLVRRAEENRDMLRGSMLEREAYYAEIRKRMLSVLGLGLNRD